MKRRPLRLLFFIPECVYPVSHGGAARITSILWALSRLGHEVHVLSLVHHEGDVEGMRGLPGVTSSEAHMLPPGPGRPGSLSPAVAQGVYRPAMARRIEELIKEHDAEILQLEYTGAAAYLGRSLGRPTVLVEHDIAYRSAWRGVKTREHGLAALYRLFDAARLYRWEIESAKRADLVLAASGEDARVLLARGVIRVSDRVPNGVDVQRLEPPGPRAETRDLLFVGYFRHPPNVDALEHFLAGVWPRLRERRPDLSVSVVGAHIPGDLAARVDAAGFRRTGYVDDLRTELWSHRVFIAPIRYGSGTRIKLLEAAAAHCAIVSTTLGAEGLGFAGGEQLLLADDSAEFADAVVRLLDDERLRHGLGDAAHAAVRDRYDWPVLVGNLEEHYLRLLGTS